MKTTSTYIPPANFVEFMERYPRLIHQIAGKYGRWFPGESAEDIRQDLSVLLMSLPIDSIYRARGCTDRISAFDPSLANDDVEGFFLLYVWRISQQYLCNRYRKFKCLQSEVTLNMEVDEYVIRLSSKQDVGLPARYNEWLRHAAAKHPLLPVVLDLLTEGRTQREISKLIGRNVKYTGLLVRMLRALVADDVETFNKWKPRLEARPRTKRATRRVA